MKIALVALAIMIATPASAYTREDDDHARRLARAIYAKAKCGGPPVPQVLIDYAVSKNIGGSVIVHEGQLEKLEKASGVEAVCAAIKKVQ